MLVFIVIALPVMIVMVGGIGLMAGVFFIGDVIHPAGGTSPGTRAAATGAVHRTYIRRSIFRAGFVGAIGAIGTDFRSGAGRLIRPRFLARYSATTTS